LPRTPGAYYALQGQAVLWSGEPSVNGYGSRRGSGGIGAGLPPLPQLRSGACSMVSLRDVNVAQAPPPLVGGREEGPARGRDLGVQCQMNSPSTQVLLPMPIQPHVPAQSKQHPHASFQQSHTLPHPHSSLFQHTPPPPPAQYYQQKQQHYQRPRMVTSPIRQRPNFTEPQRTGPLGYVEGGFNVISTPNGQVAAPRPGKGPKPAIDKSPVATPEATVAISAAMVR
jgi:hypothetical protein